MDKKEVRRMRDYILLIDCLDEKGLIYKITKILYQFGLNIISNNEFVEKKTNHFFMRSEFTGNINEGEILTEMRKELPKETTLNLIKCRKKKIVIFATKEHHCLGDLLIKNEYQEMNAEILAVISNYPDLENLVSKFKIPFHYLSHRERTRESHENEIFDVLKAYDIDYIVLAKYMRILTPTFVSKYENKIINIHHSFLPAFIGLNPYKQAFDRGVKIIGATSHFVTEKLDSGAIIVQEIVSIDHKYSVEEMQLAGREVEIIALSKALKLLFEDRVFISNNNTIIID